MRIQVNTDSSVKGDESLEAFVIETVEGSLNRFRADVSRVEVHLTDENKEKGGDDDKRCMIEVRVEGRKPDAVTHNAGNIRDAVTGAVNKSRRLLDSRLGKLKEHR